MNTPGVVGILALQTLAACAVAVFFRRSPGAHAAGRLRTVVVPVTAALLLAGVTGLVCTRLSLFTGASPAVNWTPVALTPVVFASGAVLAVRIRRTRPDVYAGLAATDVGSATSTRASPPQRRRPAASTPVHTAATGCRARPVAAVGLRAPEGRGQDSPPLPVRTLTGLPSAVGRRGPPYRRRPRSARPR